MKNVRRSHGQALVEFALLIPLFIFMFVVFIDIARMTASYLELSNSVREGTRYAMVHIFDETQITNVVYQYAPSLDHNKLTISSTKGLTSVEIFASYAYYPLTPGLKIFLGGSDSVTLTVQSSATLAPLYQ